MADLKEAFRRLDPASPLDGNLREAYYVGRPSDPVGKLSKLLEYSESPQHILLVGQRGVGKTTELLRLADSLSPNSLWFIDSIGGEDLEHPGLGVSRILHRVWRHVREQLDSTTSSGSLVGDFGNVLDVIGDLKSAGRNLALLLDGMERLRGEDVRHAARFVAELRQLGCSVVAVVPLAFWLSSEFGSEVSEWDRVVTLPAVSIQTRNREPDEVGRGLLRSVIEQRVGIELFDEEAMTFLVEQSGGIHRDLLTLAQDACLGASLDSQSQVTLNHVKAAVDERRLTQSSRLTTQFHKALNHVRIHKRIDNGTIFLQLLELNLIVAYQDSSTWFDVHPIVRPFIDYLA
jgi:DNA polymerase III delta prime subunit